MSQLRAFLRGLKPVAPIEPEIGFETDAGYQMQLDWVEFRRGRSGQVLLYAFCATLGYRRASHVEFVDNMRLDTLITCHERSFIAFGGVPKQALSDNMKTVVTERDHYGEGQHPFHAGFLDYARHAGFTIKLCRPSFHSNPERRPKASSSASMATCAARFMSRWSPGSPSAVWCSTWRAPVDQA